MLVNQRVWTDPRILMVLPVAIVLRLVIGMGGVAVHSEEEVGLHPSTPQTEAAPQGGPLLLERRIKKINLDGSVAYDPLSPLAAAAAFGGAILLVGGTLSILSWRKSATGPSESAQDPIVRNTAQPRTGR